MKKRAIIKSKTELVSASDYERLFHLKKLYNAKHDNGSTEITRQAALKEYIKESALLLYRIISAVVDKTDIAYMNLYGYDYVLSEFISIKKFYPAFYNRRFDAYITKCFDKGINAID